MVSNKLSPTLQLALRYERLLNDDFKSLYLSEGQQGRWEIVMQYTGQITSVINDEAIIVHDLQGGFAQIFIDKDQIGPLSDQMQVVYLGLPARYEYININPGPICATELFSLNSSYHVTGEGVLLAIIDSGIDYRLPEFINAEGRSRILYLWDQTLEGIEGPLQQGRVFTRQQLDTALSFSSATEQLQSVPSVDELGHGTALASIAAASGNNRGIAPDCEMLIVKIGKVGSPAPRDVELMGGIDFCIERAKELGRPLTILIAVGSNLTAHDGSAPLEQYIHERYNSWLCNFVVGTGNEGDKGTHASGQLVEGQTQTIELLMEGDKIGYACCIWKLFTDSFTLTIEAPTGESSDELSILTPNRAYLFDQTAVLINFSEPTISSGRQECYIIFQGQNGAVINPGIWRFSMRGDVILQGKYNMWASIVREIGDNTRFLNVDIEMTLTSPATEERITSVGAYNGLTQQIAAFSGRGYTAGCQIKPELVAPGVSINVVLPRESELTPVFSGTSMASAFVAGAYVLMMQYGILQLKNVNLYGETLKSYLVRAARRASIHSPYPNRSWGFGTLCIENALLILTQVADQSQ